MISSHLRLPYFVLVLASTGHAFAQAAPDTPAGAATPEAPAAAPAEAAPAAPAAATATAPAPAPAAAPAAAPAKAAEPPKEPEPAWPQSETECEDWADHPTDAIRKLWSKDLSERYAVRLVPTVGGMLGYGLSDLGFRVGSRVDVGVVQPLLLSGSAYFVSTGSGKGLQLDVLTGFNFVSYGTRWVGAGAAAAGSSVIAWNSHCQLRRSEFALAVGAKTLLKGPDDKSMLLLQAGFQSSFRRDDAFTTWSLTGLATPNFKSYGGQLVLGVSGGFIPSPVYFGTTMGGVVGEHKGLWGTLDLGAYFEI
jgi:hypothetical protein